MKGCGAAQLVPQGEHGADVTRIPPSDLGPLRAGRGARQSSGEFGEFGTHLPAVDALLVSLTTGRVNPLPVVVADVAADLPPHWA